MSVRTVSRSRPLSLAGVVTLTLALGACSALRFGGPAYDVSGSWEGSVTADGQRIPGTLAIEQDGRTLDVAFVAPEFGLSAEGTGQVDDDGGVQVELAYNLQCPGTAFMEGTVSEDRDTLSGTLEATDCTGTVGGSFRFTR